MTTERTQKINDKVEKVLKAKARHLGELQESLSREKAAYDAAVKDAQDAEDAGDGEAYGIACASKDMRQRRIRRTELEISDFDRLQSMPVADYDKIRDEITQGSADSVRTACAEIYDHITQIEKITEACREEGAELARIALELRMAAGAGRDDNGNPLYREPVFSSIPDPDFLRSMSAHKLIYSMKD